MTRDAKYNSSRKGKARNARMASTDYRQGYLAGYKAGQRASGTAKKRTSARKTRPAVRIFSSVFNKTWLTILLLARYQRTDMFTHYYLFHTVGSSKVENNYRQPIFQTQG